MANEILKAALEYAARGWFVLPLNPGSKVADWKLTSQLEFDWLTETKPDAETITRWFDLVPDLNIGIRMRGSGLTVVDIDVLDKWLIWHASEDPLVLTVPCVQTQSGHHYFFQLSPLDHCGVIHSDKGDYVGDCLAAIPPEWYPSDRAYVVAPPSKHPSFGKVYEWLVFPDEGEWMVMPQWIRDAVSNPIPPSSWWDDEDDYYDAEQELEDYMESHWWEFEPDPEPDPEREAVVQELFDKRVAEGADPNMDMGPLYELAEEILAERAQASDEVPGDE